MKKVLLLFMCLLAVCGSMDAKKTWKRGQAEWAKIQLNESLSYDQAFGMVLETVSNRYEMEMISKDGGYIRSAWNFLVDRRGKKIKPALPDHGQVQSRQNADSGQDRSAEAQEKRVDRRHGYRCGCTNQRRSSRSSRNLIGCYLDCARIMRVPS